MGLVLLVEPHNVLHRSTPKEYCFILMFFTASNVPLLCLSSPTRFIQSGIIRSTYRHVQKFVPVIPKDKRDKYADMKEDEFELLS